MLFRSLRARGFYEARASHLVRFDPAGTAIVTVSVDRGPNVTVTFAGDQLPESDRDRLVPVRSEGSVDEDLLEDSNFAIEEYLRGRGYRNAVSGYTRTARDGQLNITFTVSRGPRYVLDGLEIVGNSSILTAELQELVRLKPGEPFVQATLNGGVGAIRVDDYPTTVYVEGEPADLVERIERLAAEAAEAGDLEAHALYTSPDGADRKSTRLNSSHSQQSRMPSSA